VDKSEKELKIQRILVALDASTHSLAALQAAAGLAAALQAELIGLFVEDENLLHLAGLPFAHEVLSPSATRQRMSSHKMEQQLRLQAWQARQALEAAAERVNARWHFRIIRGQVTDSVLKAALEADLLALGRVSRPLSPRTRLGSTARAASTGTNRSVLIVQHGRDLSYPVLVTYDGSPRARQALETATKMAQASGGELNVLLISDTFEAAKPLRDEVTEWLRDHGLSATYHWLPDTRVVTLADMIQAAKECVLVLGGDNPLLQADAIQELLDTTDCPVLLVR